MAASTATASPRTSVATASGQKPALPWSSAVRIAWRELQASRVKFAFVLLSVAIGVGALTGVRGFSESLGGVLLSQARGILAADLSARMNRELSPAEQARLDAYAQAAHIQQTKVTEMISMAALSTAPVPLLVTLKIVDPLVYPFYGSVKLDPAVSLPSLLTDSTVVVDESLLVRLSAHVGDTLRIGGHPFRIAGLIRKEPDRLTAGVGVGPRVMMTRSAVDKTGLLQPGSRWTERFLYKTQPGQAIAPIRARLQEILPEAQVADFRESAPALTEGLDEATGLLSLICLVAMVLGAIGVAMAMRAHLQQRIDGIAIMKAMGARTTDILRIYVLQTLMLGGAGAVLGVLLGLVVEFSLPAVLGTLLPLRPPLRLPLLSVSSAFGTGILTTMLFSLPPLLDVRNIRPSVVLRRMVESPATTKSFWSGAGGHDRDHRASACWDCDSAFKLLERRPLVCRCARGIACRPAWPGDAVVARTEAAARAHPPLAPVFAAAGPGQSLPARQPVGRGAGRAWGGGHAYPQRLSHAELDHCAHAQLDRYEHPKRLHDRHQHGRVGWRPCFAQIPARRDRRVGRATDPLGTHHGAQRYAHQPAWPEDLPQAPAAHCIAHLGQQAARRHSADPGSLVD